MADTPILKTPGEMISAARRAQDLTLADLSARTRIPVAVLESLERDEYHRISGPLYIKSFLRTCAGEMGLEADELLELYGRFSGEVKSGVGESTWEEEQVEVTQIGLPWGRLVLVAVAAAAVLVAGVLLLRGCGSDGTDEASPVATEPEVREAAPDSAAVVVSDTVAAGAMAAGAAPDETDADETGAADGEVGTRTGEDDRAAEPVRTPQPSPPPRERTVPAGGAARDLPAAVAADSLLGFQGGRRWRVVLRIVTREPVVVEVARDGEDGYHRVRWPAPGSEAPELPGRGLQPGLAYAVREGLAVYWGASERFRLRMAETEGVEVSLNGVPWDVSGLRPGEEMNLDLWVLRNRAGR